MRPPVHHRCRSALKLLAIAALALIGAGCESLGQDLKEFTENLTPKTPGEAARAMLDPYDSDSRRTGTLLISNSDFGGVEIYVTAYRDMVQHETDPIALSAAVRALARHGTPDDAVLIAQKLQHENVQVRWEAAKGLQRLHDPTVVPDLLVLLRNDQEFADIRIAAAVALGQYPQDRVFQGLVAALDARELAVNLAAQQSLDSLTGQSHGLDARAWLVWYREASREGLAFADPIAYEYPTYQRDQSLLEKMAFWSKPHYEQPAPPTGLRPEGERRTYEDDDAEHETGG